MIVYGTNIKSDRDLLLNLPEDREVYYDLCLAEMPPSWLLNSITCGFPFSPYQGTHGRHVYLYSDRVLDDVAKGQPFCYEVKDVVRFFWVSGNKTVYYILDKDGDTRLLSFWLVHLFLPLYYTLEDMYEVLHGGAVEISGSPVLFFAPSMGGKSTMTQYFLQQGHSLVSDDKIPLVQEVDRFLVGNSHPYYRPYRKYEDLGLYTKNCIKTFQPIQSAYLLSAVDASVDINEIRGQEKFGIVLASFLYQFRFLKKRRLLCISELLKKIRLFRVSVPWDLSRQEQVYEAICSHCLEIR